MSTTTHLANQNPSISILLGFRSNFVGPRLRNMKREMTTMLLNAASTMVVQVVSKSHFGQNRFGNQLQLLEPLVIYHYSTFSFFSL